MVDFIGAARDPQFRQDVGQGLVDAFGRGLSMIGGAPVDLTTMFLRPLGYSVPDEQIVGSSEYIGRQMANLGLISETRNPAAEFLSALLIPDPTDIQKLAPYVQRAMSADLVAARPSTPDAAMRAQRGSVGVEPLKTQAPYQGEKIVGDYQIAHKPMTISGGAAPLYDLEDVFGSDIYGKNALQYFGSGGFDKQEKYILDVMKKVRGKPDEMVEIYRGVPEGVNKINPGDWVTLSPDIAAEYGNVLKMKVPAKDITSWPDSLLEFGYFPTKQTDVSPPRPQAPREEALRGSVKVEKPTAPEVKPGDIKTSYRGGEIIQKRKFDNDTEIELTVNIDPEDNLASAYLDAGGSGLETDGEVPTGTGTATAMYKNALQWAKDKGAGWISDSIMSNQSQRMYERLIEQGIPFELGGLPGYPSQYFLSAEKLATLPDEVLAAKYSPENIDDAMPRLFDLLAAEASPPRPQAPREEALRIAQENAAKPVSEGGLGLPPDNTAMDRARAMGFDDADLYHGTTNDFPAFKVSDRSNVYATDEPRIADIYANAIGRHRGLREVNAGPNVMPLMYRGKLIEVSDQGAGGGGWVKDNLAAALGTEPKRNLYKEVPSKGYSGVKIKEMDDLGGRQSQYVFPDPSVLRSRFAAFDPARRYESDLLGSVDPRLLAILGPATAAAVYGLGELYANQRRDEQTR